MTIPWLPRFVIRLGGLAISQGERVPWYMGPAWYLVYTDRVVFLPMPLNWIAAWGRNLWLRVHRVELQDAIGEAYRYGHNKGFKEGSDHGYDKGLRHGKILFDEWRKGLQ